MLRFFCVEFLLVAKFAPVHAHFLIQLAHKPFLLSHWQTEIKKHVMKAALKKGVESGELVQVKASYKLSADAKKAAKKKPAKKKVAAKKPAVKKVSLYQNR